MESRNTIVLGHGLVTYSIFIKQLYWWILLAHIAFQLVSILSCLLTPELIPVLTLLQCPSLTLEPPSLGRSSNTLTLMVLLRAKAKWTAVNRGCVLNSNKNTQQFHICHKLLILELERETYLFTNQYHIFICLWDQVSFCKGEHTLVRSLLVSRFIIIIILVQYTKSYQELSLTSITADQEFGLLDISTNQNCVDKSLKI